jgi:glycosyltransferase involved in cell wall biosynthesis
VSDAPLRVLLVSSLWPPHVLGGAETYAASLADHLTDAGHEVGVVTLGVSGPGVVAQVRPRPYRLDDFASQSSWRRAQFHALDVYRRETRRVLTAAFEDFRPDVVHTHSVQGLSSAALEAPSRSGVAHVHTVHDYWLLCQRATLVKRDGSACDRRCGSCLAVSTIRNRLIARHPPDVVIGVSDAIAHEHRGIPWMQSRLRVIRNPIDVTPRPHSAARTPMTFGYLGQITAEKGVPSLIDAFARADLPGARLLIAGEGALRTALQASAPPDVEFLGWIDPGQKDTFYAAIDCLVVPSRWKDPAPLVVNEARARGIPVIGARIGGIPELVGPASEPLLFESGNVGDLATRLTNVAASPNAFADQSDTGLQQWPEHLAAVIDTYRTALASPERRTAGRRP